MAPDYLNNEREHWDDVESKNKREDATYSTKILYTKKEAEQLRIKATLFVSKIKELVKNDN